MTQRQNCWSMYLSRGTLSMLQEIAGVLGYMATRGPGAGKLPSASAMIDALAVGEAMVVRRPGEDWEEVIKVLQAAYLGEQPGRRARFVIGELLNDISLVAKRPT